MTGAEPVVTGTQEEQKKAEYRKQIAEGLAAGTPEALCSLAALCAEEQFQLLAGDDNGLNRFARIMAVWAREDGASYPLSDTIIGRTAAFFEEPLQAVTQEQLTEVYRLLKFAVLRLQSDLPLQDQMEGVARVLVLGLTPVAVYCAAETESADRDRTLQAFAGILEREELVTAYPQAVRMRLILQSLLEQDEA